jgi:hypothetical protein
MANSWLFAKLMGLNNVLFHGLFNGILMGLLMGCTHGFFMVSSWDDLQ